MDEKTLTTLLSKEFAQQDTRFEAKLNKTLSKSLTKFEKRLDARFDAKLERQKTDLMKHMDQALTDQAHGYRDFTHQEIAASENRLAKRIEDSETKILLAVAETHDYFVWPRLNNVEKRLLKLEAKVA